MDHGIFLLVLRSRRSSSSQPGLLLLLRLGTILIQQLKQLRSSVLIQGMRELGDGGWYLETLVQNSLLPLKTDVFRPFEETGEVSLGSDVLAYAQTEFQSNKRDNDTATHQYQSSWHWPRIKGSSTPW